MSAPICRARSMPPPRGANSPSVLRRPLLPELATRARRVRSPNGARPLPRSPRKSRRADTAIRDAERKQRELDREIARLEADRAQKPPSKLEVRIELAAAAATKATLRVTYAVRNARWAPLYDARLDTGAKDRKPALELVRRAEITQNTGEDWSNVALSRFDRAHRARRQRAGSEFADRAISAAAAAVPHPRAAAMDSARPAAARRHGQGGRAACRTRPTNSRPRRKSAASR